MNHYTDDQIRKMTAEQRAILLENAKRLKTPEAKELIEQIYALGVPLSSGAIRMSDPIFERMRDVIWSVEGQALAVQAASEGVPSLCGIDPLLQKELGASYRPQDLGTATAGSLVAELMRYRGYSSDGTSGICPDGCVARTAMKWTLDRTSGK